jgi:hypothetical protein
MYRLIVINRIQMFKDVFTPELILGICWEETFFNNVKQTVGTAVGFGQTEPSNFWILESADARANGYFVSGLPRRQTLKKGKDEITILLGSLSDEQSVQVVSGFLCHLYLEAFPKRIQHGTKFSSLSRTHSGADYLETISLLES